MYIKTTKITITDTFQDNKSNYSVREKNWNFQFGHTAVEKAVTVWPDFLTSKLHHLTPVSCSTTAVRLDPPITGG